MAKKLLSNQRSLARATLKARVGRVPEFAFVFDPLGISVDDFTAFKALLGVQTVVALHAVRVAVTSHVQQAAKIQITLVTTEVLTMPVAVLSLSVLPAKDQLQEKTTRKKKNVFSLSIRRAVYAVITFSQKEDKQLKGGKRVFHELIS